jgi:ELWxxDGT repeat protein
VVDSSGNPILFPHALQAFDDRLAFAAWLRGDDALWVTDGTASGTVPVKTFGPIVLYGLERELAVVGERLYFAALSNEHGVELFALPAGD